MNKIELRFYYNQQPNGKGLNEEYARDYIWKALLTADRDKLPAIKIEQQDNSSFIIMVSAKDVNVAALIRGLNRKKSSATII